ncbi:sterol desaturase family protein [Ekhidna sp.]|uniref:sterol desaturase family protein n=1 Tax=Ekhidna sp. TaxID=2608089 RepID=UPI003C7BC534
MDVIEVVTRSISLNLLRYFGVAGFAFLIFYVIFKSRWSYWKIQQTFPKPNDYWREIIFSLITVIIFMVVAVIVFASPLRSYTLQYERIEALGRGYWWLSIFLMILLHDTYFYWMHRVMHHPKIFKWVHRTHHQSTNPSPWAAYAFHPIEAFFEASIIFPIAFLIPFHRTALLAFLIFMIVYNVYGHLGYELYPKGFNRHWLGRWINTSVNHNQHHKQFTGNYGLYFLFWDRIMGTLRTDYDDAYQQSDSKRMKS